MFFLYFLIELVYAHKFLGLSWANSLEHELPLRLLVGASILLTGSIIHIFYLRTSPSSLDTQFKSLKEATILTIFSPSSIKTKAQDILEKTFESLPLSFACIASYKKDKVNIISQHSNEKNLKVMDGPIEAQNLNNLEKMILEFYASGKQKDMVVLNGHAAFLVALKPAHLTKPIGLFVALFEKKATIKDLYYEILDFLTQNLGFSLSISIKKDETLEAALAQKSPLAKTLLPQGVEPYMKLQETLVHEAKRYKRYGAPLTLIAFSIDHYENLYNIFGEEKGSKLVNEIALLVKDNIRSTDLITHWEKEIFAIVLADNTFREATALSNKLQNLIKKRHFGSLGKATCSFGTSMLMSNEDSIESLKMRARQALEKARAAGGNRVEVVLLVS